MILEQILGAMPGDPGWIRPLPRGEHGLQSWMYPICIVLGFIVAIALACIKMWKRYKISVEPFYWFVLFGVPLAILGANFGSCVLHDSWVRAGCPGSSSPGKPWSDFFSDFGSGLAIEWGVLFVVVAALIYFPLVLRANRYKVRDEFGPIPKVKQTSFLLYFDAVMPCILIAQFIGRWGNYCNQEVYGAVVTNEGLANFLNKCLPGMYINNAWRQPLFFWEGIANLGMFFVLYIGVEFINVRKAGDMGAAYVLWYGALRLGLEPLRDQQFKSNATMVMSALFVVAGALFIILNHTVGVLLRNKMKYGFVSWKPTKEKDLAYHKHMIEKYSAQIKELESRVSAVGTDGKTYTFDGSVDQQVIHNLKSKLLKEEQILSKHEKEYSSSDWDGKVIADGKMDLYYGRW